MAKPYTHSQNVGDAVETKSSRDPAEGSGQWCNQADGLLEEDDAIRAQGGAA